MLTRIEAISFLENEWKSMVGIYRYQNGKKLNVEEALHLAVEALKQAGLSEQNKLPIEVGNTAFIHIEELPQCGGDYIKTETVVEVSNLRLWTDGCEWKFSEIGEKIFVSLDAARAKYPTARLDWEVDVC